MITLSIDVTKLDKTLFKNVVRRSGEKAIYCDLVLIETPQSKYGDYMVKQGLSKEEREAGKKLPILGNGKIFNSRKTPAAPEPPAEAEEPPGSDDDVPF